MNKEEIKEYLKRVEELELKLTGEDKETLQWLIYGYNECARLLYQLETNRDEAIEYIENEGFGYDITGDGYYCLGEEEQKELLSILERGKE